MWAGSQSTEKCIFSKSMYHNHSLTTSPIPWHTLKLKLRAVLLRVALYYNLTFISLITRSQVELFIMNYEVDRISNTNMREIRILCIYVQIIQIQLADCSACCR